ncbi:MAG TPA: hypothetical protein VLJ44_06770, partial [Gaiellaceae bacterium]|nr:hypothetical protein [Gaiellaceae bacterium]
MKRVRVDWEIAKRGWRRYAAYPWATVAGAFTNTIFGGHGVHTSRTQEQVRELAELMACPVIQTS